MTWKQLALWTLVVDFALLTAFAIYSEGYLAFVPLALGFAKSGVWGAQMMIDFLLALGVALGFVVADARRRGQSAWPFVAAHPDAGLARPAHLPADSRARHGAAARGRAGGRTARLKPRRLTNRVSSPIFARLRLAARTRFAACCRRELRGDVALERGLDRGGVEAERGAQRLVVGASLAEQREQTTARRAIAVGLDPGRRSGRLQVGGARILVGRAPRSSARAGAARSSRPPRRRRCSSERSLRVSPGCARESRSESSASPSFSQ